MPKHDSSRRVVVTGGAGFVGSHLVDSLLARGHQVTAVDTLLTGSTENIDHLRDNSRFVFLQQDVAHPLTLEADEIYNLACPASPVHYQADPIGTTRTSVYGAMNMLELATRQGACILQASTSEIYGDPEIHPQPETYWGRVNPIGPRACYDEGKRAAESLFFDFHRQHGTRIKVARIFNTYGPRMRPDDGRVASNFIVHALRNLPLDVHGDGMQTRSFCYVDDLVDGLIRLMETADEVTGPINLGNPEEVSMLELADRVKRMTNSTSSLVFHPVREDDPPQRRPDITRARDVLGWNPAVSLNEGLARTIESFRARA